MEFIHGKCQVSFFPGESQGERQLQESGTTMVNSSLITNAGGLFFMKMWTGQRVFLPRCCWTFNVCTSVTTYETSGFLFVCVWGGGGGGGKGAGTRGGRGGSSGRLDSESATTRLKREKGGSGEGVATRDEPGVAPEAS